MSQHKTPQFCASSFSHCHPLMQLKPAYHRCWSPHSPGLSLCLCQPDRCCAGHNMLALYCTHAMDWRPLSATIAGNDSSALQTRAQLWLLSGSVFYWIASPCGSGAQCLCMAITARFSVGMLSRRWCAAQEEAAPAHHFQQSRTLGCSGEHEHRACCLVSWRKCSWRSFGRCKCLAEGSNDTSCGSDSQFVAVLEHWCWCGIRQWRQ